MNQTTEQRPDPYVELAIDTIARWIIADRITSMELSTEDYPEIGEDDLVLIAKRMDRLGERMNPQSEKVDSAYRFLTGRADHE